MGLDTRWLAAWLGAVVACSAAAQTSPAQEASQAPAASAAASAAPGTFADGVKAFDAGNYAEALRLWLPLATRGSAAAQFNVAFLYEKGLGVAKDPEKAAHWQAQAASASEKAPQAARPARDEPAGGRDRFRLDPDDVTSFDGGRYVLSRAESGECVIALQGTVTKSTGDRFDDIVEKARQRGCARPVTLLLESPGGLVSAGIAIGRGVHVERMNTVARYSCASSCSIIFMGGAERTLWGSRAQIGLHQPSLHRENEKVEEKQCRTSSFDASVIAMRRYTAFVLPQTAEAIMDVVMSTPCTSITWVKGQRAVELGVATRIEAEREDVFGPRSARVSPGPPTPE